MVISVCDNDNPELEHDVVYHENSTRKFARKGMLKILKMLKKNTSPVSKRETSQKCQDYSIECIDIGNMCQTITLEYASSVNANCSTVDAIVMGGVLSIAHDHFCLLRAIITYPVEKNDNE